jgi:hypothetical protein
MKKIISPIIASIILIYGCDKVDNPIPETDNIDTSGLQFDTSFVESDPAIRKIVLEEFTGHLCSQCPTGAIKIEQLITAYGTQLIPVSIHAGSFATALTNGSFETDFKTSVGTAILETPDFTTNSYPAGMVSRILHTNGKTTNGKDTWETIIQQIENDVPKVSIKITNLYNDSLRTIIETIKTEWLSTESNNYKLQVYLLEDHIIDWQKDGSNDISNYDHRHVLRKSLNADFGTTIPSSTAGDIDEQEFTFQIPAEWDVENCIIVAFVYDVTTNEILQGEEIHIK